MSDDVPNQRRGLRPPNGPAKGAGIAYGSKGDGWGGPAKGAGHVAEKAAAFDAGNTAAAGYHDMSKSQRVDAIDEMLFGLAMNAAREETRVTAGLGLRDRYEPKVSRQEVDATIRRSAADFSDAELAAIAGEGEGEEGTIEAGGSTH